MNHDSDKNGKEIADNSYNNDTSSKTVTVKVNSQWLQR